jgi:hypothetical protein
MFPAVALTVVLWVGRRNVVQLARAAALVALSGFARWAWPDQLSQLDQTTLDVGAGLGRAVLSGRDPRRQAELLELGRTFADATR